MEAAAREVAEQRAEAAAYAAESAAAAAAAAEVAMACTGGAPFDARDAVAERHAHAMALEKGQQEAARRTASGSRARSVEVASSHRKHVEALEATNAAVRDELQAVDLALQMKRTEAQAAQHSAAAAAAEAAEAERAAYECDGGQGGARRRRALRRWPRVDARRQSGAGACRGEMAEEAFDACRAMRGLERLQSSRSIERRPS